MITDTYHPTVDGIVRYLDYLIPELLHQGHHVTVLCPRLRGFDYSQLEQLGLAVVPAWTSPWKVNAYYFALPNARFVRAIRQADAVVLHSLMPLGLLGGLLAKLFGKKVALFCHHDERVILQRILRLKPPLVRLLFSLIRKYYRQVVEVFFHATERFKRKLLFFGVQERQIIRTPFAIDKSRFHPYAEKDLRQKYHLPKEAFIATYLGRLSVEKNVETIIKALDKAMTFVPELYALIVGTGPDKEKILQQERRNADRFIFPGFIPDDELQSHYACSDLFVTPTLNESSCFTVFEAMACQTPVLTAKKDHDPEIRHGVNALLIENVLDSQEIMENVLLAISNKQLRERIAKNGYRLISSYSWKNHAERFTAALLSRDSLKKAFKKKLLPDGTRRLLKRNKKLPSN